MSQSIPSYGDFRRRLSKIGLSYVEVLLASVIMAVLLVSAVRLFGNIGRSSAMVADQNIASVLAVEMIREIKQLPYKDPASAIQGELGPEAGESGAGRSLFDDVDDYHGWTATPPQDKAGAAWGQYPNFTRRVQMQFVAADDFSLPVVSDEGFKSITITISHADRTLTQQTYVIADIANFTIDNSLPLPQPPPVGGNNE